MTTEHTEQVAKELYRKASIAFDKWLKLHEDETFTLDDVCKQLNLIDSEKREAMSKVLWYEAHKPKPRLEKSNRIYRYINNNINILKWWELGEVDQYIPITFPASHDPDDMSYFSFQDSVRMSPASVAVFAGMTNAGKSLIARHLVWDNMDKHKVRLMVSQTSSHAFARYAKNMKWANPMNGDSPKFDLIERYDDFQDIILPDGFNIVDWLDADKIDYYKIGMLIKGMQIKLTTGILVVMLQKNSDKEWGDGGVKGAKWADLYITLSYNREQNFSRAQILKAKEWIGDHDPNGKNYGFEIVNYGSQLANIREVKKCPKCWGYGKIKNEDCFNCNGLGWVDGFRVTYKPVQMEIEPDEIPD